MNTQAHIQLPIQKSALSDALKKSKESVKIIYSREFILSREQFATKGINIPKFLSAVTGTSRRFSEDMDNNPSYQYSTDEHSKHNQLIGSAPSASSKGEARSFPEMFNSLKLESFHSSSFQSNFKNYSQINASISALEIEDGCSVIKIPRMLYNGMDGMNYRKIFMFKNEEFVMY